ncbi:hypothetical protein FXO37_15338 [Capsicum annuum]|nr:hypothetical protein FXO37_15338 [Capsicum annuum]
MPSSLRLMILEDQVPCILCLAPHPLSKRLEVRSPPLVNGENSVASSLPLSALTVKRSISLTAAGQKLVNLVSSECGEQRLSSCSCSDSSSSNRKSSTTEVGSVGRISFLLENEKIEAKQQHKREKTEQLIVSVVVWSSRKVAVDSGRSRGFSRRKRVSRMVMNVMRIAIFGSLMLWQYQDRFVISEEVDLMTPIKEVIEDFQVLKSLILLMCVNGNFVRLSLFYVPLLMVSSPVPISACEYPSKNERRESWVLRYRFQISSSISVSSESSSFKDMIVRYIDKDHFSILELLFYTKELGYEAVRGFYYQVAYEGELLVAVGKNGNNQMYPIAWAVMDTETKHSWDWFISYLIVDLNLGTDPDQHVECWYKKETFLKSYSHFIQPITNMRMWPKTKNPSIESPKPRKMPDRPGKNKRKKKDKPKKWGKLSKKVSRSLVQGASKLAITRLMGWGSSNSSQPSCQPEASWNPPPPQSRSICGDTSAMARHTYTQSAAGRGKGAAGRGKGCSGKDGGSGSGQFGADRGGERGIGRGRGAAGIGKGISGMDDGSGSRQFGADRGDEGGIGKGQGGSGRGLPRKIANARGTPFKSGRNVSSSQVPPLPTRSYNATSFATATGYKRPATGFGIYYDPATGIHVYNPGTSSERVLYGGINLRSASPTNIDIGFKPSGLKWNGKDAVTSTQLQQMKANKRKKVEAAKSSLSIRSSKK